MWNAFGMGWGLGIFAVMHMVLWWALIGLGIVALVKWLAFGSASTDQRLGRHALDILGERYARGEMAKEEFEQKRRDLAR
jgi:putative membrane protein